MERLLLREAEARAAIGLGKTKFYELLGSGAIESFKIGRVRVIPATSIERWIADQLAAERRRRAAQRTVNQQDG